MLDFLLDTLKKRCPEWEFSLQSITRGNDVKKQTIFVSIPEHDNAKMLIDVDTYLKDTDTDNMDTVVDDIINSIKGRANHIFTNDMKIIETLITDFEKAKDYVGFAICNRTTNVKFLTNVSYWPIKDLDDLVLYPILSFEGSSIVVDNLMLERMKVTPTEIYYAAMRNLEKHTVIMSFREFVKNNKVFDFGSSDTCFPMYIITNKNMYKGAAQIVDRGSLLKFANELESDLIVCPSSIHECILIPVETCPSGLIDDVSEIVKCVNETEVADDEILSNDAFIFERNEMKFRKI